MKFQILTQYNSWWIPVCILAGLAYAWLLYSKFTIPEDQSPWFKRILFVIRTIAVSILAFLLLSPMIRTLSRETEKPLLLFAQDVSSSTLLNSDSLYYKTSYQEQVINMLDKLKEKYDVNILSWGDKVREGIDTSWSDKVTDFDPLYDQMDIRLGNRNVGAVVIASDGLYNQGSNPLYLKGPSVPVYTIAMGDTNVRKDLLIGRLNYNKTVYVGNSFPIEITLDARMCGGAQASLTIRDDSSLVFSRNISISGNRFSQVVPVVFDAKSKGLKHYRIEVSQLAGEVTYFNNTSDVYIDIRESKQQILIVANAPHPDLAAIRSALESSGNYSVKIQMAADVNVTLREYNLIILHNLPGKENSVSELIRNAEKDELPVLYILGAQTSIPQFNALRALISINSNLDKTNPVQGAVNKGFSLFSLSDEVKDNIPFFPPLLTPFGRYTYNSDHYNLLTQQVGSVSTQDPLLVFSGNAAVRSGVLCGEGIWRWKFDDYARHGNFNVFNEIITKTVQNLVIKETKSRFRLIARNDYAENEPVTMDAEVYNNSYELINEPDVKLTITNRDNKIFPYLFSKTDRSYSLNAGYLPAGDYRYKATVNAGDQIFTNEGSFSIHALLAEKSETVSDHQLLNSLASKSGGKMYSPKDLSSLEKDLLNRDDLKVVSYSHFKLQDLVNMKLVFFLILGLLSLEWFLRKRSGSY